MKSIRYVCVGALALCVAVAAMPGSLNDGQRYECLEVPSSHCGRHFSNDWYARVPNARGLGIPESSLEFQDFLPLLDLNNYCSHMLFNLLCFHYFPKCDPNRPELAATPCREVCIEAVAACLPHARIASNFVFPPEHLNCSHFVSVHLPSGVTGSSPEGSGDQEIATTSPDPGPIACPNATIHIEFCPVLGSKCFEVEEGAESVEVCLKLANTGSFDRSMDLAVNVTVNIRTHKTSSAEPDYDYVSLSQEIHFPIGSPKETTLCVTIPIIDDGLKENMEELTVTAEITSPSSAIFGGAVNSPSGSCSIKIFDNDNPVMPEGECRGSGCNWRDRVNKNTFRRNPYSYAAHIEIVGCRDSLLDVIIMECKELVLNSGVCPRDGVKHSIPYCDVCINECPVGEEYLLAGQHLDGSIFVTNSKRGGLFVPWGRKVSNNWRTWVDEATTSSG